MSFSHFFAQNCGVPLIFFFFFWLHWVFVAACGLSLVAVSGGLLFVAVHGLLIAMASRCRARALETRASVVVVHGLSSCGSLALEHRLSTCGTWA